MKLPDDIKKFFQQQGATGGRTRAENLSPEERSDSARKAVQARWAKTKRVSKTTKNGTVLKSTRKTKQSGGTK